MLKIILPLLLLSHSILAQPYTIHSPNNRISLTITPGKALTWQASLDDTVVIENAVVSMNFSSGPDFGMQFEIEKDQVTKSSTMIHPVVPYKDADIKDEFVQLTLTFAFGYQLNFRAYNDGIAYQFVDLGNNTRNVVGERMSLTFPMGSHALFPQEESMYSHNERLYPDKTLTEISSSDFCSLPVMFITGRAKVLFTETALHDYPGMFIRGNNNTTVDAIFPKFILEVVDSKNGPDRNQTIVKEADYIARISGNREYPWRVFIISDDDRTFVESNLAYQLARPTVLENTDWIKPGKVAWDWYNANNIFGVDFTSGLNTATYKYYIDFAAANGIEYVILDEGWTKSTTDILHVNPEMDVRELIRYGDEHGVGIILWVLWKPLDANLTEILQTYKSWGAKGVKVDFMQRNDQYMVSSYERIAKECARLELLVDFHGAFKPAGLQRMYPNVINVEGVKGAENNKWSTDITPEHNVTLPFIRMAAGPMDYTPGAMVNAQKDNYVSRFTRPMSQGTRAHQVAMYVVYEAPLQMLCESPSIYMKEQETVDFIAQIPTTWDETIVLQGKVGDYIAVARRHGTTWYIGTMTDWTPRDLQLDLSFLSEGKYSLEVFGDGVNADRYAEDYIIESRKATRGDKVSAKLAPGGGWVAILSHE